MTEEQIEKMIREAEEFADEDKKVKERPGEEESDKKGNSDGEWRWRWGWDDEYDDDEEEDDMCIFSDMMLYNVH